jgi:hypothetical protein
MTLEEKILNDIEKTGFTVELKTVSALIDNDWQVEHGSTYEDYDENKSREIDVIASKTMYIEDISFRISFYLIIEVKKSSRPWIIFTTNRRFGTLGWSILHRSNNSRITKPLSGEGSGTFRDSVFGMKAVTKNTPREYKFRVGKAFHELEKQPGEKSKIFEAIMSASKAAYYHCEKYKEADEADFQPNKDTNLSIYLPVVVLDGLLYEVYNGYSGEIELHKQEFIPVELNYASPKYRKHNWDAHFNPDLIEFNFLSTYISQIETWRQSMIEFISEDLRKAGKKPDPIWDI